jgi:hypothetical protein
LPLSEEAYYIYSILSSKQFFKLSYHLNRFLNPLPSPR